MSAELGQNDHTLSSNGALTVKVAHQLPTRPCASPSDLCVFCGKRNLYEPDNGKTPRWEILIPCHDCTCDLTWWDQGGLKQNARVGRGEVGIVPPEMTHSKRWLGEANIILLGLNPDWVQSFDLGLISDLIIEPFQRLALLDPLISGLAQEMERESAVEIRSPLSQMAALGHCLAARLILLLRRRSWEPPRPERRLSAETMKRVADYVEAHLGDKITVAVMAKEARLSTGHFSVLFKFTTGMTPEQYLLGMRLMRAKALIESGAYTVSQVAYLAGFADHSHLSTQFKRRFGSPPKVYLPSIRTV